jgi:hypothetical protein
LFFKLLCYLVIRRNCLSRRNVCYSILNNVSGREVEMFQDYANIKEDSVKYNAILPPSAPVRRLCLYETTLTDIIIEWLHDMQYGWVSDEIFEARIISRASVITLRLMITNSKLIMVYCGQTEVIRVKQQIISSHLPSRYSLLYYN